MPVKYLSLVIDIGCEMHCVCTPRSPGNSDSRRFISQTPRLLRRSIPSSSGPAPALLRRTTLPPLSVAHRENQPEPNRAGGLRELRDPRMALWEGVACLCLTAAPQRCAAAYFAEARSLTPRVFLGSRGPPREKQGVPYRAIHDVFV